MKIIEKQHKEKRGKPSFVRYVEVTDRDLYNFDNPVFLSCNAKRYNNGKTPRNDGFSNEIIKKISPETLKRVVGKDWKQGCLENYFKKIVLDETTKAISKLMIMNDDVVNLRDGQYLAYIDKKDKWKSYTMNNLLLYQNTYFPLTKILVEEFKFNIFMRIRFPKEMYELFKKTRTQRNYVRKQFIHNT